MTRISSVPMLLLDRVKRHEDEVRETRNRKYLVTYFYQYYLASADVKSVSSVRYMSPFILLSMSTHILVAYALHVYGKCSPSFICSVDCNSMQSVLYVAVE